MENVKNRISPDLTGSDFQAFLTALLNFESGIDQNLLSTYIDNYEGSSYVVTNVDSYLYDGVQYPEYTGEGTAPGTPAMKDYLLKEYFEFLGVDDIWNNVPLGQQTVETIYKMQCASTNAWNFVGYQLGEAALIDAGHYKAAIDTFDGSDNLRKYYIYQDVHVWQPEHEDITTLYHIPGTPDGAQIITTRSNTWSGSFTGADGINSLDDLKVEKNMELAMRDVIRRNIDYIEKRLSDSDIGMTWEEALAKSWTNPADGQTVESSMSGIIAGAHLSGAEACVQLLKNDTIQGDETGTSILTYFQNFGGAKTIIDEPGETILTGTVTPERISCGAGPKDDLDTGDSGNNVIQVYTDRNPGVETGTSVIIRNFDFDVAAATNDTIFVSRPSDWSFSSITATSSGPNVLIHITRSDGGLEGDKTLLLIDRNLADIEANLGSLVYFSQEYPFAWSGGYSEITFNFPGDLFTIGDAGGLAFENLLIDRTDPANTKVGTLDLAGSSYNGYTMLGTSAEEVNQYMFKPGIAGSFAEMNSP